jgi:hypothetical protein
VLQRLRLPSVQLSLWTFFIWGVRIRNADGSVGAIALSLLLIGLAVIVLATRSNGFAVVVLAGITIVVWLVRIVDIALLSDHAAGFKAVHVVLGLVSLVLAGRCDAELNGRYRVRLPGRRPAPG